MIVEALAIAMLSGPAERDGVRFIGCGSIPDGMEAAPAFETFRLEVRRGALIRWERWVEPERAFAPVAHDEGCRGPVSGTLGAVEVSCAVSPERYQIAYRSSYDAGEIFIDRQTGRMTSSARRLDSDVVHSNSGACGPTTDPSRRRPDQARF